MANMRAINLILRIAELICSIVAFAVVAKYDGWSKVNYMLFTGITSMIICLVFGVLYIIKADENPTVRLIELVVNILWWIFWFACAITMSTTLSDLGGYWDKGDFQASVAFCWITWVLWSVSTVLSFFGTRSKAGPSGGATPSAPQTNVV